MTLVTDAMVDRFRAAYTASVEADDKPLRESWRLGIAAAIGDEWRDISTAPKIEGAPVWDMSVELRGCHIRPGDTELWCTHLAGPDEVYAAPDRETAERWALQLNDLGRRANDGVPPEDQILFQASAQVWPRSAKEHADNLDYAIDVMTSRRMIERSL